jgi:hypothetical protein
MTEWCKWGSNKEAPPGEVHVELHRYDFSGEWLTRKAKDLV